MAKRSGDASTAPVVVLYDDRVHALTGLKIAALSVRAHTRDWTVIAVVPGAPGAFVEWAAQHGIEVRTDLSTGGASGWDVKPTLLATMLRAGHQRVVWFDTDIVATGDLTRLLDSDADEVLLATEEYYWGYHQGSPARTLALGRPAARVFPKALNSGILRVSATHLPLLDEWAAVLAGDAYRRAQESPVSQQSIGFLGDQEVLSGLLGTAEYADIPVRQLRRGVDIAQCFGPSGFTVRERWRSRGALPPLIHAMDVKPWRKVPRAARTTSLLRWTWQSVHLDLTPYVQAAGPYLASIDEDTSWALPATGLGRLLSRVPSPALRELPLAIVDTAQRGLRRTLGIRQIPA